MIRLSCSFCEWIGSSILTRDLRLSELCLDGKEIRLQGDPLHDLLVRLAIGLPEKVDCRAQRYRLLVSTK